MHITDITEYQSKAIARSVNNVYEALRAEGFSDEGASGLTVALFKGALAND